MEEPEKKYIIQIQEVKQQPESGFSLGGIYMFGFLASLVLCYAVAEDNKPETILAAVLMSAGWPFFLLLLIVKLFM